MPILFVFLIVLIILFSSHFDRLAKFYNKSDIKFKVFVPLLIVQVIGIILAIVTLFLISGENYYFGLFLILPGTFWFIFSYYILRSNLGDILKEGFYWWMFIGYFLWIIPGYILALSTQKKKIK